MSIFQKLFNLTKPILKKEDVSNFEKVTRFVTWFIKNDQFVKVISNRSNNIIFNEGYRPKSGNKNNPESVDSEISSLTEWFIVKIFIDINMLKGVTGEEFRQFIDILQESGEETLITIGEITQKHNINFEDFIYEKEIEKIPVGTEREWFKINFLDDGVSGAEVRILAWLYHEYFNEWYQPKKVSDT